jgi:LmbE family N-acetylglucosaminyl deacetylase
MKILIISPHPDDMEIWMGGTVAKLVDEGNEVRSIVLTDGHRSPRSFECSDEEMVKTRRKEGTEAHKILGITDFEYFSLPNADDKVKVTDIFASEIKKNFNRIYMPDVEDMHPTHKLVAEYVLSIVDSLHLTPEIFAYDGWNFLHHPLVFVDIEKYLNKKVAAVRANKSQIQDKPYDEAVEKLARVRAILMDSHTITDIKYAEAFKKIK